MAGILDWLSMQQDGQSGGGLLGGINSGIQNMFGGQQGMVLSGLGLASGATPQEGFKNMMPALQQAYEQQQAQRAGMALLGALPGGNQPPQQPSSFGAMGPGASYAKPPMMPGSAPIMPPQFMPAGPVAPPLNAPRPPIMPTSKVWGDDEAVAAGLYDPPKTGAPSPQPQMAQNDPATLPPNAMPTQGGPVPGPPTQPRPQGPPPGSPALNQPGSGLQLIDSPALQGMPDTVRKALPLMFASKQYAPQAMALIQKYINPDQWQLWRDNMGNVFTRNSATGESKPLLTPTPDMMNANASGMSSPFQYQAATQLSGSAAKNTELTPEQKNANASGGMTPAELKAREAQDTGLASAWVKKYESSVDAGTAARQMLPQLQAAKNVIETDKNFYSGFGEGYNQSLKKIWVAIGGDPNTAAPQELVSKILSGQIVGGLRTAFGGLGQVRVAELNALQNSLAAMKNSPEALRALITMNIKTQQRAADIADLAQSYDNGSGRLNAGFDRAVADYDRKNPVFSQQEISDWKKIAGTPATPPKTVNPYEAEARRRGLIQ